jgi:hypothetical protein
MASLKLKSRRTIEAELAANGTASALSGQSPAPLGEVLPSPRLPLNPPRGKVRLSADIRRELYQKLRVHIAMTNSRINTFIENLIEKHC